jgi:hypothetical protein
LTSGEFLIIGDPHSRHDSISSAASASSLSSDGPVHVQAYSADTGGQRYGQPPPNSVPLSRRPSLATSVSAARRESVKRAPTDAGAPTYDSGPVHVAGERNQRMTARIEKYLTEDPEHPVERSKSLPTPGSAVWGALNLGSETQDAQPIVIPPVEEDEEGADDGPAKQSKPWKKKSKHLTNFARRRSKDLTSLFR